MSPDPKDIALMVCAVTVDLVLAVHTEASDPVRIQALAAKEAIRMAEDATGPSVAAMARVERFLHEYDSSEMMLDGEVRTLWKRAIAMMLDEVVAEADQDGYKRGKKWGWAEERNRILRMLEGPCSDEEHKPDWCGRCEQRRDDVAAIKASKRPGEE